MCINDRKCHAWVSLHSLGVPACGCLRDSSWRHEVAGIVPCHQSIFDPVLYIDLPTEKLTCLKNVSHGKFGYIDLALYETKEESREVYIKRPIIAGKSLLYEACIQLSVGDYLKENGFPTGAPRVVRIFKLRDGSVCFAMDSIAHAVTLDRYLDGLTSSQIQPVVVECLFQLSSMMWHLSMHMGMNHRDLKPSNFLIVEHEKPFQRIITIGNEIIELSSHFSLTLIDFGFSCIGTMDTRKSLISLSSVYSARDPCPKDGRDMYLFLGLFYIDYHQRLTTDLKRLFEQWLEVSSSTNLCHFIRRNPDKNVAKQWLYFIAGNEDIPSYQSCPVRIIRDLHQTV